MKLKLLAISDTHVGEDTSILSFPQGRQALWRALRRAFSGDYREDDPSSSSRFEVDELILMGDIPDRTLSSTSEVITHTTALSDTLGSAAKVTKAVYVPGNHDHTVWTAYAKGRPSGSPSVTSPAGEELVKDGLPINTGDSVRPLLELFFSYPGGQGWRAIQDNKQPHFHIANPLYATSLETPLGTRTYVFAHGTHFRWFEVTRPLWMRKRACGVRLVRTLAGSALQPGGEIVEGMSLEQLEDAVTPLVDTLWASAGNQPTSIRDQTWAAITAEMRRLKEVRDRRCKDKLYDWATLSQGGPHGIDGRVACMTPGGRLDRPLEFWTRYFRQPMVHHLRTHSLPTEHLTFVFGDTHGGGWGVVPGEADDNIRIYNTGAWVVDRPDDHPPCHLFAVMEDGTECLLDVTFADERVGTEDLLTLAAQGLEHRGRKRPWKLGILAWLGHRAVSKYLKWRQNTLLAGL
ncbi:MAG: metallophosphoesterase [Armatimonadetes bacterium]|nr:metallophosphoesterase [Armatimonadota bacterium]